ncbi:hypothetical protein DPMN_052376 [Dreissena polymorpha]|uniref:Uncharacterized protein n=1 Tax=Dreissena polymorpha TaxID=45954 RepID=A0A9D4CKW6_DREPO|nr:hypothetical protein DPMN_052376 [Dreissena polymorpha]
MTDSMRVSQAGCQVANSAWVCVTGWSPAGTTFPTLFSFWDDPPTHKRSRPAADVPCTPRKCIYYLSDPMPLS